MTVVAQVKDVPSRADNTSSLGTADSGQAWTVPTAGAVFGIISNTFYQNGGVTTQAIAVIESAQPNVVVRITTAVSGDSGPCWRETDDNNYWIFVDHHTAGGKVFKRVAGSFTQVGATQSNGANGDTCVITVNGSSLVVTRNGTQLISTTDAFNSTATKHGIRINFDAAARLSNFAVEAIAVPLLSLFQAVRRAANY